MGRDPGKASPHQGLGEFGPFERILEGYLTLLHLDRRASRVIAAIARIVRDAHDSPPYIERMLADPDWRPQLIGAVATLCTPMPSPFVPYLWNAVDRGSWVAPQIAVVLLLVDPRFAEAAKRRVMAGCTVIEPSIRSRLLRHVMTGPAPTPERSAKNLSALLGLLALLPHEESWTRAAMTRPDLRDLHALDRDGGGDIALHWRAALSNRFAELYLSLPSAVV